MGWLIVVVISLFGKGIVERDVRFAVGLEKESNARASADHPPKGDGKS